MFKIGPKISFDDLLNQVKELKKEYSQKEIYFALEKLRKNFPEQDEDIILEVMDIVCGHCDKSKRLWDTIYN